EGFEGTFPREGWDIEDLNPDSGRYYWGKRDCRARSGRYSAWCVGAGDSSISCGSNYRNDMFSWMVYGPFSLADASAAELVFDWTLETGYMYDSFWWVASTDGEYFYGYGATGGKGNWITGEKLDLSAVPTGSGSINMLGEDQVWIAFVFESDYVETDKGSFVDNVLLRKRVGAYGSIGEGVTSSPRVLQDDQDMRPIKLRRAQQE
ncbi:MAG: hypothetical protein FJY85_19715, partial [Deltaproteobacteria bacterium]|nr:hypothetical protein [Deltaproteobacteria bacterium]